VGSTVIGMVSRVALYPGIETVWGVRGTCWCCRSAGSCSPSGMAHCWVEKLVLCHFILVVKVGDYSLFGSLVRVVDCDAPRDVAWGVCEWGTVRSLRGEVGSDRRCGRSSDRG